MACFPHYRTNSELIPKWCGSTVRMFRTRLSLGPRGPSVTAERRFVNLRNKSHETKIHRTKNGATPMLNSQRDTTRMSAKFLPTNRNIIEDFFGNDLICEKYAAKRMHEIEGTNGKLPPDMEAKKHQMARYDTAHRRRKQVMHVIGKSDGLKSTEIQAQFDEDIWKDLTILRRDGLITSRRSKTGENVWKLTLKGASAISRGGEPYKTAEDYAREKREASNKIILGDLKAHPFSDATTIARRTKISVTRVRRYLNDMREEGRADWVEKKLPVSAGKGTKRVRFWHVGA